MLTLLEQVYSPAVDALELYTIADPSWEKEKLKVPELRNAAELHYQSLSEKEKVWATFLPDIINSKIAEFVSASRAAIVPSNPEYFEGDEELSRLVKAYQQVVDAIRSELAIEPLSKKTWNRITETKKPSSTITE